MRRVYDFHGGIYPPERKSLSNSEAIRRPALPKQLILPLLQHIGAPAVAIVEPGQQVLGGERLTDLSSLPIHAPTSGVITAIEDRPIPHVSGFLGLCIVIDCDGKDRWVELEPLENFRGLSPSDLVQRIFEAGIAGLGGAGFPTAWKLPKDENNGIDTLIINGTECEPYITADDALMRERTQDIISGIEILAHIARPSEILIGVEDNKPEAIAAFRLALSGRSDIELVVFPTKYPSGGEKQLIEILTGKQVPSGDLPSSIGILCQNVGSAAAVHDAIIHGRPLVSRVTTVTGESARSRGNFEVLLGTPMQDLLVQADYQPADPQRLIMGGPMMGVTLGDHHCPVVKTTNCLLVPGLQELPEPDPAQACIRCGLCAEACPARLLPQQLYWFARAQDHERLEEHHLFDCIECGACSYVCPSHIPLVQYYRASKAAIDEQKEDNARSDHARERFEARQERMARATAEKEAKRAARKQAAIAKAENQTGDSDPIQAAIARAQARKAARAANPVNDHQVQQEKLARIEARLAKAREKLAADDGSDPTIATALQNAVRTTERKLTDLQAELAGTAVKPDNETENA
ncbi:MAG: electron transport complex protein RnfC [Glaciecola sp.]|jgi:electron transport complex protein RnfC